MKTIILGVLVLCLLVALTTQTSTMDDIVEQAFNEVMSESFSESSTCTVTASSLSVRSGPSTSNSRLTYVYRNQRVSRVDSKSYNGWAKIRTSNGQTGYSSLSYLQCSSSSSGSSSSGSSSSGTSCTVTASSLNVRSGPSTGYAAIGYVYRNNRITRVDSNTYSGSWSKVRLSNGKVGYVASTYLNCGGSSSGGSSSGGSSSGGSSSGGSSTNRCAQSTKLHDSLKKIFGHEGKCQNWSNDRGNYMSGISQPGYTCAGIIPSVGWNNKGMFSYASSCTTSVQKHMFVKCAWDKSNSKFKDVAAKIYENQYARAGGCVSLPQPAYYVCFDIAVNSGPGRSKQFINQLGAYRSDAISYATRLNELHRQFYIAISKPGTKNAKFRSGWLNRAASRDRYIQSCR